MSEKTIKNKTKQDQQLYKSATVCLKARENGFVLNFSLNSCSGAILINTGWVLQSFGAETTKV